MTDTRTRRPDLDRVQASDADSMLPPRTPWPVAVMTAAVAAAALFTDWSAASLVVLLWLTSRHMPGQTTIRRLAVAVVFLFGVNTAVLTILAVAGLRAEGQWVLASYLVAAALARPSTTARVRGSATSAQHDTWALGCFVVTFIALSWPFIGASAGQISALLSRVTDGGTHLSLVRAVMQEGGYIGLLPSVPGTLPGLADYPSGWAGNMALVIEVLLGSEPEPRPFLVAASLLIVGLYSLLSLFATIVALDVARAVAGPLGAGAAAAAAACVLLTTLLGTTALLVTSSSYAQIAATTLLLAVISIVLHPPAARGAGTGLLALLSVALFHTWYLLAPVLAVVLLHHLAVNRPSGGRVIASALPAGLIAAYPVVTGPRPGAQIVAAGGAHTPSAGGGLAFLLLTVVVVAALLAMNSGGRHHRRVLASTLVAALLLFAGVLTVQESGSGANYYAVKLLYTMFLVTGVGAAAVTGILVPRLRTGRTPVTSMAVVVTIFASLGASSYGVRHHVFPLLTGAAPESVSRPALAAVFSSHDSWIADDTEVWILSGCSRGGDRKATQFLNSLSLAWGPERLATFNDFLRADANDVSMLISRARDGGVRAMEVYASKDCLPDGLPALAALPKVEVIYV